MGFALPTYAWVEGISGEEAGAPPYTSHQRYFGVNTKVITAQFIPAIGFTPMEDWGLHLGAGMTYTLDIFQITMEFGREVPHGNRVIIKCCLRHHPEIKTHSLVVADPL